MKVTMEVNVWFELQDMCWSGALDTLKEVAEAGKTEELMDHLEEVFCEGASDVEVNDYLWFESDYIYECIGMKAEEDED